ncbi:hypothetical protein [Bradyrhizobium sp. Rc2d]|uniref:hypothetical protein n=1 Tax=Bradyrhizobium sp. Rc2d TaxID=1855321 RepID=UPI0011600249|nr:hypothetical protein [Bradyrhizobium sp. Rc2d]
MSQDDRWLTPEQAATLIRQRVGGSVGRSQGILGAARSSGEVRSRASADPVLLMADDGVVGMDMRPGAQNKGGVNSDGKPVVHHLSADASGARISEDDLLDWLARNHAAGAAITTVAPELSPHVRYTTDDELLAEMVQGLTEGRWPNKHQAAIAVAGRAEGSGTREATVRRLEGKVSKLLKTSRNISKD